MAKDYVLALDQGTTSSRAIVFARDGRAVGVARQEYDQIYPFPGHVEHNPEQIWSSQRDTAAQAIQAAGLTANDIAAIGVANQRETTVLWEKSTGRPVANAIVWQSRITADYCDQLKAEGLSETFRRKTGLVVDAYFSGTKIRHLLDNIPGLRAKAEAGEILFGTVDTFLLWRLSGGRLHITDHSNASRTLIFNIHTLDWDDELLRILNIPRIMLPEVRPSSEIYGETDLFGTRIPLAGNAGDQQAATFGQACFQPGDIKNTYGTGCFMLLNTGTTAVESSHGLLTTIGWKLSEKEKPVYCLEGSVFIAGAVIQWLRDELKLISTAAESEAIALSVPDTAGVYVVPAFAGLGAPHWNQNARGTIVGITRGTTRAHIVRAAVEAMAYQSADLVDAMKQDAGLHGGVLKVDGGACVNNFLMQFQADLLDQTVQRPEVQETTALGAAYLAGLATGVWSDLSDIRKNWNLDREFTPNMPTATRDRLQRKWKQAVQRSLDWRSTED